MRAIFFGLMFFVSFSSSGETLRYEGTMNADLMNDGNITVQPCFLELVLDGDQIVGFDGKGFGPVRGPNLLGTCGPTLLCSFDRDVHFGTANGFLNDPKIFGLFAWEQKGSPLEGDFTLKGKREEFLLPDDETSGVARSYVTLKRRGDKVTFKDVTYVKRILPIGKFKGTCENLKLTPQD